MRTLNLLVLAACLLFCDGCTSLPQTRGRHLVPTGEIAIVVHGSDAEVPFAVSKTDAHTLARAVETGNRATVLGMIAAGRAFMAPARTHVRVIGESYNERHIEVTEGPQTGRTGWVPYEWLELRGT